MSPVAKHATVIFVVFFQIKKYLDPDDPETQQLSQILPQKKTQLKLCQVMMHL